MEEVMDEHEHEVDWGCALASPRVTMGDFQLLMRAIAAEGPEHEDHLRSS
jgi:hypothetical protein